MDRVDYKLIGLVLVEYRISYDGLDPRVVPHVTMGFKGVRIWQKSWPGK